MKWSFIQRLSDYNESNRRDVPTFTAPPVRAAFPHLSRSKSARRLLYLCGGAVFALLLILQAAPSHAQPPPRSDDLQYLIFMIETEGLYESPTDRVFEIIDRRVAALVDRLGDVGNNKTHHLGFGLLIPPWLIEKALPGKLPIVLHDAFRVAKKRNVAVYFSIETHYIWDSRPDLWNYFDPKRPGYNPANKNNVEWMDWKGTPYPNRYLDWGTPQKLPPHMCYNCPAILSEVTRLVSHVLAPPIRAGLEELRNVHREYLFAGITVGSEPSLDNYSRINAVNPAMAKLMEQNKAPKVRLGYNALTRAGYTENNPPQDYAHALAEINQDFIAFWAKALVEAGIPKSCLYTHVPANAGPAGSAVTEFTNAPIWIAYNDYSRMGWTTYPDGPLAEDFGILYAELAKHGNPHWGGTEANPFGLSGMKVPMGDYLKRHYDHGATVVVMNSGATNPQLAERLRTGIWSPDAKRAYTAFLAGRLSAHTVATTKSSAKTRDACSGATTASESMPRESRLTAKMKAFESAARAWLIEGGESLKISAFAQQFDELLKAGHPEQAEAKLDETFRMVCEEN